MKTYTNVYTEGPWTFFNSNVIEKREGMDLFKTEGPRVGLWVKTMTYEFLKINSGWFMSTVLWFHWSWFGLTGFYLTDCKFTQNFMDCWFI